jgi:hypothetical protein
VDLDHVHRMLEWLDAADTDALAVVCVELGHADAATVARGVAVDGQTCPDL